MCVYTFFFIIALIIAIPMIIVNIHNSRELKEDEKEKKLWIDGFYRQCPICSKYDNDLNLSFENFKEKDIRFCRNCGTRINHNGVVKNDRLDASLLRDNYNSDIFNHEEFLKSKYEKKKKEIEDKIKELNYNYENKEYDDDFRTQYEELRQKRNELYEYENKSEDIILQLLRKNFDKTCSVCGKKIISRKEYEEEMNQLPEETEEEFLFKKKKLSFKEMNQATDNDVYGYNKNRELKSFCNSCLTEAIIQKDFIPIEISHLFDINQLTNIQILSKYKDIIK